MAESVFHGGDLQGQIDSLSDQIAKSAWTSLATGVSYCKKAGIVTVDFTGQNTTTLVKNAYTEIGTLPASFWPDVIIYGMVMLTSNGNKPALLRIATPGNVAIYHTYESDLSGIWGSISFPVNT